MHPKNMTLDACVCTRDERDSAQDRKRVRDRIKKVVFLFVYTAL